MSKESETGDRFLQKDHPRFLSLNIRHNITKGFEDDVVAKAGLIAHGRGEAFDYIVGERTNQPAKEAIIAAAAALLLAEHPVISVNGNVAALVPNELVELSKVAKASLEVNLFYHTEKRLTAIKNYLIAAGAKEILGLNMEVQVSIPELSSLRRHVDPKGIYIADLVLIPLEDGDRTEALKKFGKKVIAIDLNPLSRTAQWADITIVDNIIRCMPLLIQEVKNLSEKDSETLQQIVNSFNNKENLGKMIEFMGEYLSSLAEKGIYIPEAAQVFAEMKEDV
ncbi:MAG: phosphopantothenate/pantothenate synthetase [Candidatus Helarchaeota archaeon]|nr:phosphopantothenate/pantothenate synthetase [Candidatus Helarchaeota archaeon]